MNKIALFINRTYVDAHPCFTELIKELVKLNFTIDLYYIQNPYNPPPVFYSGKVRVFAFPQSKFQKMEFSFKIRTADRNYKLAIGTPIEGAAMAQQIAKMQKIPYIYLADEIYDPKIKHHNIKNWQKAKRTDINANQNALATIALGDERYEYQKKINHLSDKHQYFIIPNAQSGVAKKIQSNYFRDIFELKDRKPIILFIGTINWTLAQKIYNETKNYNEKPYHLIFHGRTHGLIGDANHRFIKISTKPLPSYLLNYAISSADIGLVLYDKLVEQEKNNAATGGKIGTYLKNNIPVIAGNVEYFKQFEKAGIGVFWDGEIDFEQVIGQAIKNKEEMMQNIPVYYQNNLDYSRFFNPFYEFLNEKIIIE